MGQNLKYLITTEELKVPIYIVHFKEKNAIVFPMLMEDSTYKEMSDFSKESNDTISDFFNMVLTGGYNLEYPTQRLFTFIVERSNLKSLAVIPYREFCDLPQNIGIPILFIKDKIIDLTKEEISEEKIHESIGAEITFNDIKKRTLINKQRCEPQSVVPCKVKSEAKNKRQCKLKQTTSP
jgi:hypothetical protein